MIDDDKMEAHLRDSELIGDDELSRALALAERANRPLFDILIEREFVAEEPLVELASEILNVEHVDPTTVDPDPEALELLPRSTAVDHWVLPLQREVSDGSARLVLAMRDPIDMRAMETVADRVDIDIRPVLAGPRALRESIADAYGVDEPGLAEGSFHYTSENSDSPDDRADPRDPDFDSKLPPTFEPEEGLMESEVESDNSDEEIHRAETADGNVEGLAREVEARYDSETELTLDGLIGQIARVNKGLEEHQLEALQSQNLETTLAAGLVALIDRGTLTVEELVDALPETD